jgi:putative oxidoreductase
MARMPKCWCLTWLRNFLIHDSNETFHEQRTPFEGTVGYIASVGLPLPSVAAAVAVALEILGSLALIIGFQTRIVAAVLAVFTLVASIFFHAFWSAAPDQAFVQQLLFFKNIGVIGGLLVLVSSGAGAWSLDAKKQAQ